MKKFIPAVVASTIVISALSFKPKTSGTAYCASIGIPTSLGGSCAIITDVTEEINGTGTTFYKFESWNGLSSSCTGNVCNTPKLFYPQPH